MKWYKITIHIILLLVSVLILTNIVSACGYFYHEDTGTRMYYGPTDRLEFIEDNVQLMTRFPTNMEKEYNVYILQSYGGLDG